MAPERGRLVDDPLLQVAVAGDAVREVVDDLEVGAIEPGGKDRSVRAIPTALAKP